MKAYKYKKGGEICLQNVGCYSQYVVAAKVRNSGRLRLPFKKFIVEDKL